MFRLAHKAFGQLFAEADGWLSQKGHRTRVIVLTDMHTWWLGVHRVQEYTNDEDEVMYRNHFQVSGKAYKDMEETLTMLVRLRRWVALVDSTMDKRADGTCATCFGDPALHRPKASHKTPEEIKALAIRDTRAEKLLLQTIDEFDFLGDDDGVEETKE